MNNNFTAVPVLAKPPGHKTDAVMQATVSRSGEARESTESEKPRKNDHRSLERVAGSDSRGGSKNFSAGRAND